MSSEDRKRKQADAALLLVADALDRSCAEILARWEEQLTTMLHAGWTDREAKEWRDAGLRLLRGLGTTLRQGQPEAAATPWAHAARTYAEARRRQDVPLAALVRELQLLRRGLSSTLQEDLARTDPAKSCDAAAQLDTAFDTATVTAARTYGAERQEGSPHAEPAPARPASSESLLRTIFDEGPLGVAMVDADFHIIKANTTLCQMLGYTEEELSGLSITDVTHPDDADRAIALARKLLAGEIPRYQIEKRHLTKGGQQVWSRVTASVVRDEAGRPLFDLSMVEDITARKRAEDEGRELVARLREANEHLVESTIGAQQQADELRTVLESIVEAVFVCDTHGTITLVNEAALALAGARRDSLHTLTDYLAALNLRYPDGRPVPRSDLAVVRALAGAATRETERLATHPVTGQHLDLLIGSAPLRDAAGTVRGAVWVVNDITRLKEMDRLKDQFVSTALHEVRTPLTILKGYAQYLQREAASCDPQFLFALAAIERQSTRIAHLVQDLFDVSRAQAGAVELHLESVNLATLAAEAVARARAAAPRHQLTLQGPSSLVVQGDRDRLELVLSELLDNAVRYSPQGGEIAVAVRKEPGKVVVSVTDQGVGIPTARQSHIFERFYRAHAGTPHDYGGLGVGLFLSREIIRRHGGEMGFTSAEDKGSTFWLSLPLP